MNILEGFFDIFKDCLIESCYQLGTILLDKLCLEINEIDNTINKSCSPNSRKKFQEDKVDFRL